MVPIRIYMEGPFLFLFIILWIGLGLILRLRYKKNYSYLVFYTLFFVYIFQLIKYTQFPITYVPDLKDISLVWDSINYVPFYRLSSNFYLNILLTLPFGFLLPFVKKVKKKSIIYWAFLLPLLIEGLQLLIALICQYTERKVDINDFIANLLGLLIGYLIFKIFINLFKKFVDKKQIKLDSILKHVYSLS